MPMGALTRSPAARSAPRRTTTARRAATWSRASRQALAELHGAKAARKALIVVGDGCDTNPDAAKTALVELKKQAKQDKIQVFAIIYKSAVSSPTTSS